MGYLKSTGTVFVYIGFFLLLITFCPNLPPSAKFTEYSITPPTELSGSLAVNGRLNEAEILFDEKLRGPESFAAYNGKLYTGLHGGQVVQIDGEKIVPVVKFGEKCHMPYQEQKCGRPLGLQFNKNGELFVIDTYYGIFKVDISTGKYQQIVDITKPVDGKLSKIINSLDIASNGDIYYTVSSTEFTINDGFYTLLADPSGRLIRYNSARKMNEVLLENLAFANGLVLSLDESFVIVAETTSSRIVKYNLKGPKMGKSEVFAEGLPGLPDNIHADGHGGFLVSLIGYADSERPILTQSLTPHPYLRKMFARLFAVIETPFKYLQEYYPNVYFERIIHNVGHFESISLDNGVVGLLRFDSNGKILEAAYGTNEKLSGISSAFVHGDYLYLGSPFNNYIARVPLKVAFPSLTDKAKPAIHKSAEATPKVTSTTPKPAATTPKPTTTTPQPTTTTPQPTTTTPQPTTTTPKPTTTTSKSTTATPKPSTTTPKPTTTTPKPATTTQKSTTQRPTTTPPPSTMKTQKPSVQKSQSTSDTAKPVKKPVEKQPQVAQKEEKHSSPSAVNSKTPKTPSVNSQELPKQKPVATAEKTTVNSPKDKPKDNGSPNRI